MTAKIWANVRVSSLYFTQVTVHEEKCGEHDQQQFLLKHSNHCFYKCAIRGYFWPDTELQGSFWAETDMNRSLR